MTIVKIVILAAPKLKYPVMHRRFIYSHETAQVSFFFELRFWIDKSLPIFSPLKYIFSPQPKRFELSQGVLGYFHVCHTYLRITKIVILKQLFISPTSKKAYDL